MRKARKNRGFSLLEIAVGLAIMSLLTVSVVTLIPQQQDQKNIDNTAAAMTKLQAAIDAYVNQNGFLPCPAPLDAAIASATYGVSSDCNGSVPSGITSIAGATTNEDVWIGAVPTRTLSLPDSYMSDGWTNRIDYAVVKALAINKAGFTGYTSAQSYTIRINDANGNAISQTNPPVANVVGYVLLSHGKDAGGATSFDGGVRRACPGTGVDRQNCLNTSPATYVDAFYNNAAAYYDDIIRWKTIQQQARDATNGGGFGPGVAITNASASIAGYSKYALFSYRVSNGSAAPSCSANAWTMRPLNSTPDYDTTNPSVTVSSNIITLPAGNYIIKAYGPASNVVFHKIRLVNASASSTLVVGSAESAGASNVTSTSIAYAVLNLTASTNIQVDHFCSTAGSLGIASAPSPNSATDVSYTHGAVEIWQQ